MKVVKLSGVSAESLTDVLKEGGVDRYTVDLQFGGKARSFPKAALAFAILLLTSASKFTAPESVLPRYVELSTAWRLCPFTVMHGSWYV